ncbi:unnamed protein product [Parnassius apollo]|uniref:(apollo) hypothetical protein n=1 Tax=Parnassius apollo TaxID=110799 RepID=A0A8S3XKW6_PARAO|nr:unnamed protein product [Parnassius apollo]
MAELIPSNALVDYSDSTHCSSTDQNSEVEKDFSGCDSDQSWHIPIRRKKKRLVFTSMDDYTCPSTSAIQIPTTIIESSDSTKESSDSTEEEDSGIVGKKGMRKKRPLPKKLKERSERWSGKGKSVKANPCLGKKCGNDCANKFTEIERNCVHELYWGLGSLQRQRDFILSCIKECEIGRKRAESDRRKISYNYYLPKGTESVKICQQFLLKTLDISQMTLRCTKSHKIASFCQNLTNAANERL